MGAPKGGNLWTFLASVSPFESLRKYLMFRHRRDQDLRYREASEKRRLKLENDARELALLEKRIKIFKQSGGTEEQLEPLRRRVLGCVPPSSPSSVPPNEILLLTSGEEAAIDSLPSANDGRDDDP